MHYSKADTELLVLSSTATTVETLGTTGIHLD
jgi:hypothetical protein